MVDFVFEKQKKIGSMTALTKSAIGLFIFFTSVHSQNQNAPCLRADDVCPNEYIKFYLYTRETSNEPYELLEDKLCDAKFAKTDDLKILVHGVFGSKDGEFNKLLRDAYFSQREYNIIAVDYAPLAPSLECYDDAVASAPIVGKCLTQLLVAVMNEHGPFKYVHAIGFSLGAQVIGIAGPLLKEKGKKFDRATGLDAALPGFEVLLNKLDVESATTVDAIHTNAGFFGQLMPIGTIDFYANGGILQPGSRGPESLFVWAFQSHKRSFEYYAESILYKPGTRLGFYANRETSLDLLSLFGGHGKKPQNKVLFGEYLDTKLTGVYGFVTNDKPPYARGELGDRSLEEENV